MAANNGAAVVLDLMGQYEEARPYFAAAIKSAHTPLERALAERAMAIGYGFAGDCGNAEKLEKRAFEFYRDTNDFPNAGDVADELARLCLDSGDFDRASEWYQRGHDTGFEEPNISSARRDLWDFRLAHARARIAARRGKEAEARKQVTKAKEILDRGHIPDQEQFFPYLEGYVAFYSRDYCRGLAVPESRIDERSVHRMPARPDLRSVGRPRASGRVLSPCRGRRRRTACPRLMRSPLRNESLRPGMRAGSNAQ